MPRTATRPGRSRASQPREESSTGPHVNRISAGVLIFFALPLAAQQPAAVPVSNKSTYNHDAAPTVRAARLTSRIDIDGKLDEPAWATATPVSDFIQRDP